MENDEERRLNEQRNKIINNITTLIDKTEYSVLSELCLKHKIITAAMLNNIEKYGSTRHMQLFLKIATRGPTAYERLLDILQDGQFYEAFNTLNEQSLDEIDSSTLRNTIIPQYENRYHLEEYSEKLPGLPNMVLSYLKTCSIRVTYDPLDVYPIQSASQQVLFLVNIIDFEDDPRNLISKRDGAEYDRNYMIDLFRKMGFRIYYKENLKRKDFDGYLNELIIHSGILEHTECLVFSLLSHGTATNEVYFHDRKSIRVEDIISQFNNQNCPLMKNKPKVFILPFCRGAIRDGFFEWNSIEYDGESENYEKPFCTDMLICYGTVPGFVTNREPNGGSWYITELYQAISKHSHNTDLEGILRIVNKQLLNKKLDFIQTPCFENIYFNKDLYFRHQ